MYLPKWPEMARNGPKLNIRRQKSKPPTRFLMPLVQIDSYIYICDLITCPKKCKKDWTALCNILSVINNLTKSKPELSEQESASAK